MSTLVDYIALFFAKIIIGAMERLPYPVSFKIAQGGVILLRLAMPRASKVAMRNLELTFPEKSAEEHREIVRQSYRVLARNLVGFAKLPRIEEEIEEIFTEEQEGLDVIAEARRQAAGKGILFPALHFGAFEQLMQLYALKVGTIKILARGFGLPRLDAWWNARRELYGCSIFNRKGGYREVTESLSSGQDVTLLCDQNVKRSHAVFAEFFGIPVATTKTVALAAMRTGAPIVCGAGFLLPSGKQKLVFKKLRHPNEIEGTREEKIYHCTKEMNSFIEYCVREQPASWFWIHRRFKTRPPGEAEDLYRDLGKPLAKKTAAN